MRPHSVIIAALTIIFATAPGYSADVYPSSERTADHTIQSEALNETREIMVRTPPDFDPEKKYPVVYVLDGEWGFELVASYLDYMSAENVYPDMIVTAVKNVNRNRDYVPREDSSFRDTGGADEFLNFVAEEWTEFVDQNYPASSKRIIIGHSFGGVFTLHALFSQPSLFDAYIALGSSAWIADRVLFDEAEAYFQDPGETSPFVYMAVGEGDGGPTVPSSRDLAKLFEDEAQDSLEWSYDETPKTDHFKNVASGMHDAFMDLFPAWEFNTQLMARAKSDGADGVRSWFDEKRSSLGYRFNPAWFDLGIVALQLAGGEDENGGEAAAAVMAELRTHYPDNAYIASFSANVFETTGDMESAEREYERTLNLARAQGLHPNAMHIDGVLQSIERVRQQQAN